MLRQTSHTLLSVGGVLGYKFSSLPQDSSGTIFCLLQSWADFVVKDTRPFNSILEGVKMVTEWSNGDNEEVEKLLSTWEENIVQYGLDEEVRNKVLHE